MQKLDVANDRPPVVPGCVLGLDPVDPEPAALVERYPDRIHVPRCHGLHGLGAARAVEDPPALDTRVLGAGAVDAAEMDDPALPVEQAVADDMEPSGRLEPGFGRRAAQADSGQERRTQDDEPEL